MINLQPSPSEITVFAPAKINVILRILDRRPDGFPTRRASCGNPRGAFATSNGCRERCNLGQSNTGCQDLARGPGPGDPPGHMTRQMRHLR